MTSAEIEALIEQYRVGLEAEVALLRRLEYVSNQQGSASKDGDLDQLNQVADTRDRLTNGLVSIEDGLREIRRRLTEVRDEAKSLPGYEETAALHREAVALVNRILNTDKASLESLAAAETARRDAARALEQGETTLTAYRKVATLAPGATLVDRRG
jgi:hypothetical protein